MTVSRIVTVTADASGRVYAFEADGTRVPLNRAGYVRDRECVAALRRFYIVDVGATVGTWTLSGMAHPDREIKPQDEAFIGRMIDHDIACEAKAKAAAAPVEPAVPQLVAEFRAIMSDPLGGIPSAEQCRAVIEFKASALPIGPELWALWHVPHGSDVATLCEFDGSICFECYRDSAAAQRAASRLNADAYSASGRYMVGRIPAGVAGNPCDIPDGESQAFRASGPAVEWSAGMEYGYTTCTVSVADLTAPADAAVAAIETGLVESGAIEAPSAAFESFEAATRHLATDGYGRTPIPGMYRKPGARDALVRRLADWRYSIAYVGPVRDAGPAMVPQVAQQQQGNAGAADLFAQLAAADVAVKRWALACANPRKHAPTMHAEFGRAFDKREALKAKALDSDPVRYARAYPLNAYGIRHLLPPGMVARIEAAETDSDMVAAVNGEAR